MKTYIYEGTEVTLTGRTANKSKKTPSGKTIESQLVEVKPVPKPGTPVWNRWVKMSDLFEVGGEVIGVDKPAST